MDTLRKIMNPGIIACVLALIIYLTGIQVPRIIAEPIKMLGCMTAPLSMLLIGSFLASKLEAVFWIKKIWLYSLFKMVIIPIIILLIMRPFVDDPSSSVLLAA